MHTPQQNAPSLDGIGRRQTGQHLVGNLAGVAHACVGVEIHPLGNAPAGEIVRVNVYADDAQAFDLVRFAAGFGCAQPLIVGPMEFVTVLEHGAQTDKILPLEPRHADRAHLIDHASTPIRCDELIVAEEREALGAAIDVGYGYVEHGAPAQISLTPIDASQVSMYWLRDSNACVGMSSAACHRMHHFQRQHGFNHAGAWFGAEYMADQRGRMWSREFRAVIDDFGDLIEVEL